MFTYLVKNAYLYCCAMKIGGASGEKISKLLFSPLGLHYLCRKNNATLPKKVLLYIK